MRLSEFNEGIEKLPAGEYRGGKSSLYVPTKFKPDSIQKLPGGSGFMYMSKIYGDTEFTSGLYATWSGT